MIKSAIFVILLSVVGTVCFFLPRGWVTQITQQTALPQVDELIEKPKQIVEKLADKVSEKHEPSINRDQTRLEKRTESSPRPPIPQVPEAAEDQQLVFEKEKEIFSSEPVADLPEVVSNEVPLVDYLEVLDPQSSTEEQLINDSNSQDENGTSSSGDSLLTQYLDLLTESDGK